MCLFNSYPVSLEQYPFVWQTPLAPLLSHASFAQQSHCQSNNHDEQSNSPIIDQTSHLHQMLPSIQQQPKSQHDHAFKLHAHISSDTPSRLSLPAVNITESQENHFDATYPPEKRVSCQSLNASPVLSHFEQACLSQSLQSQLCPQQETVAQSCCPFSSLSLPAYPQLQSSQPTPVQLTHPQHRCKNLLNKSQ